MNLIELLGWCLWLVDVASGRIKARVRGFTVDHLGESHLPLRLGHIMNILSEFMAAIIDALEANKRLADRVVEQVSDDKLHVALHEYVNSIAVIMKHIAGNCFRMDRFSDDRRGEVGA